MTPFITINADPEIASFMETLEERLIDSRSKQEDTLSETKDVINSLKTITTRGMKDLQETVDDLTQPIRQLSGLEGSVKASLTDLRSQLIQVSAQQSETLSAAMAAMTATLATQGTEQAARQEKHAEILPELIARGMEPGLNQIRLITDEMRKALSDSITGYLDHLSAEMQNRLEKLPVTLVDSIARHTEKQANQLSTLQQGHISLTERLQDMTALMEALSSRVESLQQNNDALSRLVQTQSATLEGITGDLRHMRRPWWKRIFGG